MNQEVYDLYDAIDTIIDNHDMNDIEVYGCTNYVDIRFCHLLHKIAERGDVLTKEEMTLLSDKLEAFLNYVEGNEGTYFIEESGTYSLRTSMDVLKKFITILRSV